jgi:excisionase family DNA binding protein
VTGTQHAPRFKDPDHDLLTPREVAQIFGVRTTTIARWAREGRLEFRRTPGGHRRYTASAIRRLMTEIAAENTDSPRIAEEDAARLYDQGWSIRQVAEKFDCSYGAMRRILQRHTTLRNRSGTHYKE